MKLPFFIALFFSLYSFSQEVDTTSIRLQKEVDEAVSNIDRVNAMLALGEYELDHNFSKAEAIITDAYQFVKENREELGAQKEGLVLVELGVLNRRKANYTKALAYYLEALEIFKNEKDTANSADVYHNIGMIHKFQKDYPRSDSYFNIAVETNEAIDNDIGTGQAYMMIGSNHRVRKQPDSAEIYFEKAKGLFIAAGSEENVRRVESFLTRFYISMDRFDEASALNQKSISYSKKYNKRLELINNYYIASHLYAEKKEYRTAGRYVDSGLRMARKEGLKIKIAEGYHKKSRLWYLLKRYKNAYLTHRSYKKYTDSLYDIENVKRVQELELNFKFAQEQLADSLKFAQEKKQVALLAEAESSKKQLYLVLFVSVLIAAAIITSLLRKNYKNRSQLLAMSLSQEKTEKALLDQKIEANEEEIKRLIADNSMRLAFKEELLQRLKKEIKEKDAKDLKSSLASLSTELQSQIQTEGKLSWLQDKLDDVNKGFDAKLREQFPALSKTEREICALLRLNLSIKEIMTIRNMSQDAVKSSRYRIRKKLGLTAKEELEQFIQGL